MEYGLTSYENIYGINETYAYWGAPMFEVENLLNDLSDCDFTLISVGSF